MKKIILLAALFALAVPSNQVSAGFSDAMQARDWRLPFRAVNELAKHPITQFVAPRVLVYGGCALNLLRLMTYSNYVKYMPNTFGLKKTLFQFKKNWLGSPCERPIDPIVKNGVCKDMLSHCNCTDYANTLTVILHKNEICKIHNKNYMTAMENKAAGNAIKNDEDTISAGQWATSSFELGQDPDWAKATKQFGIKFGTDILLTVALMPIFYKQISGDAASLGRAASSLWSFLTRDQRIA